MANRSDPYDGAVGRFYGFYIARPWWGRVVGRLVWASDFGPLYRSLDAVRLQVTGGNVVDVACGAGLTLRWLDPRPDLRYVGVDVSPTMLGRAQDQARRRGFRKADFRVADATSLPFTDSHVDICLLYNALHCVPDPQVVVAECARVLKPGGRLLGTMLVRGESDRADRMLQRDAARKRPLTGPGGTVADLGRWLAAGSLQAVELDASGAMVAFTAQRPDRPPDRPPR